MTKLAPLAEALRPEWLLDTDKYTGRGAPVTTNPTTVRQNFSNFGGRVVAATANAAMHYLVLRKFESDENLAFGGGTGGTGDLSPLHVMDGLTSGHITNPLGTGASVWKNFLSPVDFTAESRFGNNDWIEVSAYVDTALGAFDAIAIIFEDTSFVSRTASWNSAVITAPGQYHLKLKRSQLTGPGTMNWAAVRAIYSQFFRFAGDPIHVYWDDLRIVKADPDDATASNDTGADWNFDGGVWHIYEDEPSGETYSLGNIKHDAAEPRYTASYVPAHNVVRDIQCGVYLREEGKAGLWWGLNANNAYEVRIDTNANEVKLLEISNGTVVATHGTVSPFAIEPGVKYYVGLRRESARINAYLSRNPADLFDNTSRHITAEDLTYQGGKVGLATYGARVRFWEVQGGSPEHADGSKFASNSARVGMLSAGALMSRSLFGW